MSYKWTLSLDGMRYVAGNFLRRDCQSCDTYMRDIERVKGATVSGESRAAAHGAFVRHFRYKHADVEEQIVAGVVD
ncbi:MAG: hypothetical protein J4F28_02230 [Nitrosopumilaceae archaeon]|nr:hypothetical protein [Nitrosopumilaceae archaeon]